MDYIVYAGLLATRQLVCADYGSRPYFQVGGKHVAVEHNKRKMKVNCAVLKNEPENIRHAYM